jgi:hypothetical protein
LAVGAGIALVSGFILRSGSKSKATKRKDLGLIKDRHAPGGLQSPN